MSPSILCETDDGIGMITLNRGERHNALDETLVDELTRALDALSADPAVRVLVLSSTGRSFCAGTDTGWLMRMAEAGEPGSQEAARRLAGLMTSLNELPKPTIARVQGSAFGAGAGLVAACDIAVATYDVQFALSDTRLGLVPALVSPYLVAAIGERHSRRFMLSAERFSAAEAYRIGLVHEIVPGEEQLDEAIGEIIDNLFKGAPGAQAECKSLLQGVAGQPIDETTVEETVQRFVRSRSGFEAEEGLTAFIGKRKPNWSR